MPADVVIILSGGYAGPERAPRSTRIEVRDYDHPDLSTEVGTDDQGRRYGIGRFIGTDDSVALAHVRPGSDAWWRSFDDNLERWRRRAEEI